MDDRYVLVGVHGWSRGALDALRGTMPGTWTLVDGPEGLTLEHLRSLAPRYVFFVHWSWRVPPEVLREFECVCFHMTDVPYGRGGSPLQNLIVRGHRSTKLTALRMCEAFDAGPVYLKEDLSLEGLAEEIYLRAATTAARMIETIVRTRLVPVEQEGDVVAFRRRQPAESAITGPTDLLAMFDFIRMLDADGYPRAFFVRDGLRYEFRRPALRAGRIEADVTITPVAEP